MKLTTIKGEDPEPQDDYKGGEGWIIVTVGMEGVARIVDYAPNFGAIRYMIDTVGGDNTEELGVEDCPEEQGVFRGEFKAWSTSVHDYDGSDNDMGFNLVGEWETLWCPTWEKHWRPGDVRDDPASFVAVLRKEIDERDASFNLRWKADMRAIDRWQEAAGREEVWPDHADLCVWLLEERQKLLAALPSCSVCLEPLLPGKAEIGNPVTGVRIHVGCEKGLR